MYAILESSTGIEAFPELPTEQTLNFYFIFSM